MLGCTQVAQISVRVHPGASRDELVLEGELLRARIAAAAVDGGANQRLIEVLAKSLRVPRSSLRIVRGTRSRLKILDTGGLALPEIRARLEKS